jgi:hypothetical protein
LIRKFDARSKSKPNAGGRFSYPLHYRAAFSAIRELERKKTLSASGIFRWPFGNIPQLDTFFPEISSFAWAYPSNFTWALPSKVSVGWRIGTDRNFEFFRAQIEDAVFR